MKRIAVIDIGNLKVKMLIAEGQQALYESNTLTRLGIRMHENNNRPFPEHLEQTANELLRCKTILEQHAVEHVRVVSTHAIRVMENGTDIARQLSERSGFHIEIISPEEEAHLFFNAVLHDFTSDDDFAVADIGSGSVQLLIGNKHELKHSFHFQTGAQYLKDRFSPRHGPTDAPRPDEIERMKQHVREHIAPVPQRLNIPLIYGSSCIIDVFHSMNIPLHTYAHSKSHPYKAELSDLRTFLNTIIPIPYEEREKQYPYKQQYYMYGIDKALINILTIADHISAPYVIPSNANINQGMILALE